MNMPLVSLLPYSGEGVVQFCFLLNPRQFKLDKTISIVVESFQAVQTATAITCSLTELKPFQILMRVTERGMSTLVYS